MYGDAALRTGDHQVWLEFAYDGGGLGKGGAATLYIDGLRVGRRSATTTTPSQVRSPDGCTGFRSISVRTLKTPTT